MRGSTDPDLTAQSDRELAARMAEGDTTALGVLYDRHGPMAFGLALRVVGDRSLAEDVVEKAFMEAWRNPGQYDASAGAVRTWLTAVVYRSSIDAVRRHSSSPDTAPEGRSLRALPALHVAERSSTDAAAHPA